ncbi:hypothetical protein Esti_001660 [Eimeria stiedai]
MQPPKEAAAGSLLLLLLLLLLEACSPAVSDSSLRAWRSSESPLWRSRWARALHNSSREGVLPPSAFLLNARKPFICLYTPQQQHGCRQQLLLQRQQQQQQKPLRAEAFAVLRGLEGGARNSKRDGRACSSSSSSSKVSVSWHDLLGAPYAPMSEAESQQLLLQQAELRREDEAFAAALQEAQCDSGDEAALFGQQQQKEQPQQQRQQEDFEALQDVLAGVLGLLPNGASETAALAELEALASRPGSRRSPSGGENLTSWLEAASALQGSRAEASQEETDAAGLFGPNLLEETGRIGFSPGALLSAATVGSSSSYCSFLLLLLMDPSACFLSSSRPPMQLVAACSACITLVFAALASAAASRWWMLAAAVPAAFFAFCFSLWPRRAATPFTAGRAPAAAAAAAAAGTAATAAAAGALFCKPWIRRWTSSPLSQADEKRSSHEAAAALLRQVMQHPAVPWLLLLLPEQQQQQHLEQLQQQLQLQELLQPEDKAFLSSLLSVGTAAAAFLMPKLLSSASSSSSNSSSTSSLSVDWDGQDEAIFSRLLQLKLLQQPQQQQQQQQFKGTQLHAQQRAWTRKPLASIGSAAWARPLVEQYLFLRNQQQHQQRQQQQQQQQPREGEDGSRDNALSSQGFLSLPPLPPPAAFADRLLLFGHLLAEPAAAAAAAGFAESRSSVAAAGVAAALGVPVQLAEARLKCLLRRILSSLASRLFANLKPPAFSWSGGSGAGELLHQQQQKQQQQQQQQYKQQLLLGIEALQEAAAALRLGQHDVQAACAGALPLLLARLVASVEMFVPAFPSPNPLSSTGDPASLGGSQHGGPLHAGPQELRGAPTIRLVAGLLDAAEVAKTFASSLLSPEAAAETPQQLTSLAARRLLPALASAALTELAANGSGEPLLPLTLKQAPPSFHGRFLRGAPVDFRASSAAEQGALDAQCACFDVFAALRHGLRLGQEEFLSVVQIGVFRAGAPLRRALEGFAVMKNNEALISIARQLLTLDLQLEKLVDAACKEGAAQQPQPLVRRRRSRQLQAGGIPLGPPSAGPPDSEGKGPLKKLLLAYLRRHALLGESASTAAAEALQEAEKAYGEVGGPLSPEDRGPQQAARGLLERLVRAWDRVKMTPHCDEQESLPKEVTEYAFTLLLQQQQQQQRQQQAAAPDLASRWQQLTSIGARQEEALKAAQLRAAIAEKLGPLLGDLAKHCSSPSQGSDSRKETVPSRAENGPWGRWLLQLRSLQTSEVADALALQIRDSVLTSLSDSFGLSEESQAVAAAVEVYRQVFDKETEAVLAEALPDTPATADARRRRLLGVRAALGLAASDVSFLHAEAYKEWFLAVAKEALASEGSWTAKSASLAAEAAAQIDLAEASRSQIN